MTPHFSDAELACHCNCGGLPPQSFQDQLEQFRLVWGRPIRLSSGFRCPAYNQKVSKTGPTGPHTIGAVDVLCSGKEAWELLRAALAFGWTGIGIQQTGPREKRFIHLDGLVGSAHPRPTVWSY